MRKVAFYTTDGLVLKGVLHPSPSETIVIMCHCFLGDKDEWGFFEKIAVNIHRYGFAVLRFDMRGCGDSDDAPISLNQLQDVQTAIDWCIQEGYQQVILLGHSLGGLYVFQAQHEAIITRIGLAPVTAPPTHGWNWFTPEELKQVRKGENVTRTFDKGVRKTHEIDSMYIAQRESIDQGELLTSVSEPCLLIHGSDDTVIDVQQSLNAVPLLPADSDLKIIKNANHDFDEYHQEIIDCVREWFTRIT